MNDYEITWLDGTTEKVLNAELSRRDDGVFQIVKDRKSRWIPFTAVRQIRQL